MFDVKNWNDVRADVPGISGPGELSARSPLFPLVFNSTGVANGGTDTQAQKIPSGFVFAGFMLSGILILNATSGGALDGFPLTVDGGPTIASNTMYPASLVSVTIAGSQNNLNNSPIAWPAIVGDARSPFVFPTPHYVNGGDDVRVTISNASGVTIDSQVVIWGRKIVVG